MKTILLGLLLVASMLPSPARAFETVNKNTIRVRILSYNIKGLPAIINPDWDQDRFGDIGEILAARKRRGNAPDIVLLQESFGVRTLELQKAAGYRYAARGPSDLKIISSGLFILSQFPITFSQGLLYGDFDCGTWDCFASKGALATRIQLPGVPFQLTIATTHAQSGKGWNAPRMTQLQDFARFIKSLINPDVGVLTAGDFNTQPAQPSYHDFLARTHFSSVGETCVVPSNQCAMLNGTNQKTLLDDSDDQFFYQSGRRVSIRPISVERNFAKPFKGRMLSDHLGYEAVFEIQWH